MLFGTDLGLDRRMYEEWWRFFESADEFIPGPNWWRHYALDLPDWVLEPLYRGNAMRLPNWEPVEV